VLLCKPQVWTLTGIDLHTAISQGDWELQTQGDRRLKHSSETENFQQPEEHCQEVNLIPTTEMPSKLLLQALPSLLIAAGVFALWPSQKKRRAVISRCRKHTMYSGGHNTVKF